MNQYFEPWSTGSRLKAVVGHYGSGKSEIALAMALGARAAGYKAAVVDMDIVNPFFRSAEQGDLLREHGVRLIAPPYALTGVDLPVLSAEVLSVFEEPEQFSVLDVGGDDAGAAALGRFKPQLDRHKTDLYYVVNCFRPYSRTPEQVIDMLRRIARRARIQPTGLINNANLGLDTEPRHLAEGDALLKTVSAETGLPIVCACALPRVLDGMPDIDTPVFPIERRLMPQWLEQ